MDESRHRRPGAWARFLRTIDEIARYTDQTLRLEIGRSQGFLLVTVHAPRALMLDRYEPGDRRRFSVPVRVTFAYQRWDCAVRNFFRCGEFRRAVTPRERLSPFGRSIRVTFSVAFHWTVDTALRHAVAVGSRSFCFRAFRYATSSCGQRIDVFGSERWQPVWLFRSRLMSALLFAVVEAVSTTSAVANYTEERVGDENDNLDYYYDDDDHDDDDNERGDSGHVLVIDGIDGDRAAESERHDIGWRLIDNYHNQHDSCRSNVFPAAAQQQQQQEIQPQCTNESRRLPIAAIVAYRDIAAQLLLRTYVEERRRCRRSRKYGRDSRRPSFSKYAQTCATSLSSVVSASSSSSSSSFSSVSVPSIFSQTSDSAQWYSARLLPELQRYIRLRNLPSMPSALSRTAQPSRRLGGSLLSSMLFEPWFVIPVLVDGSLNLYELTGNIPETLQQCYTETIRVTRLTMLPRPGYLEYDHWDDLELLRFMVDADTAIQLLERGDRIDRATGTLQRQSPSASIHDQLLLQYSPRLFRWWIHEPAHLADNSVSLDRSSSILP